MGSASNPQRIFGAAALSVCFFAIAAEHTRNQLKSIVQELRCLVGFEDASQRVWSSVLPGSCGGRELLSGLSADKNLKLLLTSDLFDVNDGGSLPRLLTEMMEDATSPGSPKSAVWLRDGRAGWPQDFVYERFVNVDLPGLLRMRQLGISSHMGIWLDRHIAPGAHMLLEEDMASNSSREVDLEAVIALIDNATVLYVPGGQPWVLLHNLRRHPGSAVWAHALKRIQEGKMVYLARSAGTIIAGGNVDITGFQNASSIDGARRLLGDPINWAGLELVPAVALRPHYRPGGMIGSERRHGGNRGDWSDDDFIEHLRTEHAGIVGVAFKDGDFLAVNRGKVSLGNAIL